MVELLRSNDAVLLSWVTALLRDGGIEPVLLDQHASIMEGSISAIQRRLMVESDDVSRARQILSNAGVSHRCE